MKQVLILGAYGQNNIGDEALLQVFASQFKDYQVVVNSAQPELTAQRYNLKTIPTHLNWPPFSGLSAILRSDIMVFGGGSLLKEIEGNSFTRTFYCIRIIILLLIARLLGHRTLMLGVGMGPLHGKLYCTLSRIAANMTDLICVRDADSAKLLREIGVRRQVHVTADPVFLLAQSLEVQPVQNCRELAEAPIVAVMPRYSLTQVQLEKLAEACDHMVEKYGAYIWIIPFQTGYLPKYDDLITSNSLKSLMKHPEAAEVKVLETPTEVMEALGQTDLVLSTRLHALIFAAIKAVPCIALSYEVKVAGFMSEVGLEENTLTLKDLEQGKLNNILDVTWQKREAIAENLKVKATQLEVASARNFELANDKINDKPSGGLLRSGAMLFISITIVNAGNYLFNLVLGRWLGPSAFAELSLIVTLTLVITFISSTLQTVAAKFSAMYTVDNDLEQLSGLRKWLLRIASGFGFSLMLITLASAQFLTEFFHTSSPWPFILLAIAFPFCFSQGVDRGILQGKTRFGLLALSYQAEMWVRLGGAVVLVAAGFSVSGAVGAILLSFIATWYVARKVRKQLPHNGHFQPTERTKALHFAVPVSVALIGQVLLNNSDIIIVNHFFEQHAAGQYAAVALIGRIVFFATWSVVTTLFPVVAQLERQGKSHRHLLGYSLGLVGVISSLILVATILQPELIMSILFGNAYLESAPLLWMYALATAFYSMANVIITYRLSAGNGGGSVFAIVAGISQVLGLCIWHESLQQVVLIQVYIMAGLFTLLLLWDTWLTFQRVLVRKTL